MVWSSILGFHKRKRNARCQRKSSRSLIGSVIFANYLSQIVSFSDWKTRFRCTICCIHGSEYTSQVKWHHGLTNRNVNNAIMRMEKFTENVFPLEISIWLDNRKEWRTTRSIFFSCISRLNKQRILGRLIAASNWILLIQSLSRTLEWMLSRIR